MNKIRVFIKRPNEDPFMAPISNDTETLQSYVAGTVQKVTLCEDFAILYDGNSALSDKKFNFTIGRHQFFGTVIFVGLKDNEFTDVPCTYGTFRDMFKNLYNERR